MGKWEDIAKFGIEVKKMISGAREERKAELYYILDLRIEALNKIDGRNKKRLANALISSYNAFERMTR